MAHVFVSLGSNINRQNNTLLGVKALQQQFGSLQLSSLVESDAVGFAGAAFYNMVIAFYTELSVQQVADILRTIEYKYGREKNAKKFSPRTLDLDMLLFDDLIIESPVQIPRNEITANAFVLFPLSEIAGHLCHPVNKLSYKQLWQDYDKSKQPLRIITVNWQG
jgi:2-amino-4-hydroxy-6-hydroxymethyldihydropteridine diphosphokinase